MRRAAPLLLALFTMSQATAQDQKGLEDSIREVLDQALRINIVARVYPGQGEEPVALSKLTVPGHAVAVRLEGSNVQIRANLTPYILENGRLVLVAQGEVWFSEPSAQDAVQYLSSIESLPIELGEKIFFYPLGLPDPMKGTNHFNLALEIQIVPLDGDHGGA